MYALTLTFYWLRFLLSLSVLVLVFIGIDKPMGESELFDYLIRFISHSKTPTATAYSAHAAGEFLAPWLPILLFSLLFLLSVSLRWLYLARFVILLDTLCAMVFSTLFALPLLALVVTFTKPVKAGILSARGNPKHQKQRIEPTFGPS
ncbi:hypothetical protein P2G88_00290 [Aliiglaciecola sp. CAU 1673]|uniref:hypothetical protein n=1 Tax=Aliiglaciecola sp. CAU 1673 TaxID=3032595 RepID=UPI0023DB59DE|nr:hypothetical protein [Aliiglaciecola sp. CAU 1673]MDF2176685.1 hypothetical protein [Aliiglaciecola sp. CAU 1673]